MLLHGLPSITFLMVSMVVHFDTDSCDNCLIYLWGI
jgi:hypothetical protein